MATSADPVAEHHVSGLYTTMLMDFVASVLSADEIGDILHRAGEARTIDELNDMRSWSSYRQFRRLLEEAKVALDSASCAGKDHPPPMSMGNTELAQSIQSLGSPGAVLATGDGFNVLVPIRRYELTELGPNEWTIGEWFVDGYAPYPEFCEFVTRQYAQIPMFFGLPPAEVTQEQCQCRGDAVCLFRVRWELVDEATTRAEYLEVRAQLLEARLEQLQAMVTDLASNERYEDVLQGIVGSSLRAVGASGALLALEPRSGSPRKVYSEGLTGADAASMADDLLEGGAGRPGIAAIAVASVRHHYGVLALDEDGGLFTSQVRVILETYAQLAAAALDAADAMEDARHLANTAQALLGLSTSLAEIVSTGEMASKVARAVPDVIDCDRAAVFLHHGDAGAATPEEFRLAGSVGYPDEVVSEAGSRVFKGGGRYMVSESGLVESSFSEVGTLASVSAPITVAGEVIGFIVAGVTSDPERLTITPRLVERLKGLAAQASIAIANARLVDQIRFQALHDALTGLPNRALILDRTEQLLARARRFPVQVAALFIDLDGFKGVNDSLGHGVGDQLLRAVSERLTLTMRESDSVGRLGGDEFLVLLDGPSMDAGPELVAERLLEVVRAPFDLEGSVGGPVTLTASIGIAVGSRPTAAELLRDADIALYEAKAAGKDRFVVFEPKMHTVVQDQHLLEMDLRDALASEAFFLVYQPIFNLAGGQTIGVEALLRWDHPDRGVVGPDEFIPVLEDSGMICEVGAWVLTEACRQGAHWHALGYQLDVSVNVSARQLETDRLVDDVRCALATSGFDPHSLIIEITETAIMKHVATVVPRLTVLKATGVRVAIDDFGTGYSSLAYLQQLPVDTLKIDRLFISSMADSPESGALIRTLVQLGKTLGLETLAEGIEESEQYSQLQREQCDSGQGYLYARPLEADAVAAFLAAQSVVGTPDPVEAHPAGTRLPFVIAF
ncbi:MAG: EAL domain-containing protein [Acidimicrobiales bacterium]